MIFLLKGIWGEFNPQHLNYLFEQINKPSSLDPPVMSRASSVTETTSIEVVMSDGTSSVATYDGGSLPLDLADCNLYDQQTFASRTPTLTSINDAT